MAITSTGLRGLRARPAAGARPLAAPFWLWSLCLALLAAGALLWPLTEGLQSRSIDDGDGLHLAWTLRYAQEALLRPGAGFGAPAAYPYASTLLLNPPLYAMAALGLPLLALGWSATAVYNALTLLSFVLACWALMLLGRGLTGSALAGAAAGLVYAFADVRLAHLAHLNLLSGFWTALLLAVLLGAWRAPPRTARGLAALAVGAGLLAAAQALSDLYNALYMALAAGLLAALWGGQGLLVGALRGRRAAAAAGLHALAALGAGALLAGALVAPVLLPTIAAWQEQGVARPWADHEALRAAPAHYAVAAHSRPLYDLAGLRARGLAADPVEQRLWPGAAALLLAGLGLAGGPRRLRRERLYLAALAAAAFALSLGPQLALGGRAVELPWYRWLFEHAPLFAAARAPARWALLLQLALAALAAIGAARILAMAPAGGGRPSALRRAAQGALLPAALLGLVVADVAPGAPRLSDAIVGAPTPEVYQALAALPPGALLEWPLENASPTLKHRQQHYTLAHGRPIVNAAASAPPPRLAQVHSLLRAFPSAATTRFLHELGVRYVVVSRWEIGGWSELAPRLAAAPGLRLMGEYEGGRHLLYELLAEQPAAPAPVAVVAPAPGGARLTAQLAAPLWLDAPQRLYRGERATPVGLLLPGGATLTTTLSLPPVLMPGLHSWELPAAAAGAVALELGGQRVPLSPAPAATPADGQAHLAAAPLPARLAPGAGLPCLAFGDLPERDGLVLAAALVDAGWGVVAKADYFLAPAAPGAGAAALPCGLDLPADMQPGDYFLALGLYDVAAGAFVPVVGADGARSEGLLRVGGPIAVAR